ncbi:MAG: thioredoxin domain-containing protein [Deltaproteobacteria bacterium]|nr:thioredoxin domain-containing protein [Deltaproteobacteria bacterium]
MSARRCIAAVFSLAVALIGCHRHDGPTRAPMPASSSAGHGAIEWSPWTRESFARAAAEHRIILVNVVATWCHWCHVMEETTYDDPEVVALLREHFTTIRVDSDARPDVAERYREWGWPATGFLSPDAAPVLELRGYQDPRSFAKILRGLVADRERGQLAHRGAPPAPQPADVAELDALRVRVTAQLDGFYEPELGGWGKAQRYPSPAPIEHALFRTVAHADAAWRARAEQTLAGAASLIDPVWGGIYQYSVDGDWQHPHYEKITTLQAGAIGVFAKAHRLTGERRWLDAASSIARYMATRMQAPEGGFYTSQDADLRVTGKPAVEGARYYALDDAGRRALGVPRIDTHVYADQSGMMIEALAELYATTGDDTWRALAIDTASAMIERHRTDDGAFTHAAGDAGLLHLRDQIAMGRGLLALFRVRADPRWLAHAEATARFMLTHLQGPRGGFYAHTADPEAVGVFAERRMPTEENGQAARMLAALHRHEDGDGGLATPYLDAARRALAVLGDPKAIAAEGRIVGSYLMGLEEVVMPIVDITVVGDLGDGGATAALHRAALAIYEPRAVIELQHPGERYPDVGKPAVYLCTQTACSTPITKPARLAATAAAFIADSLPTSR